MKSLISAIGLSLSLSAFGSAPKAPSEQVAEEWLNYLQTANDVSKVLMSAPAYKKDPVGAMDIMTGMMITNFNAFMSSSGTGFRGRPRWSAFDNPNTRLGIDNPDTRYLSAHIPNGKGKNIYRVWGNRSNTRDMILLTNDPSNPNGGGATLEDEDMVNINGTALKHNEDFVVYLSSKDEYDPTYMHNWMELGKSNQITIASRYTACNYKSQTPGDIHVERVGTEGKTMTAEEFRSPEIMASQIKMATSVLKNQQPFWAKYSQMIMDTTKVNTLPNWQPTGGLGITSQLSTSGYAKLADDEALIISFPSNTPADYGSLQLFNSWGSSLPWGHAQVNSSFGCEGNSNSFATKDGYTHMVISNKDPGVHNWLNTMGHEEIFFSGRLQSVVPELREKVLKGDYKPVSRVVKLKRLKWILPRDTKWVSQEEREKQVRERQLYQKRKYAPW